MKPKTVSIVGLLVFALLAAMPAWGQQVTAAQLNFVGLLPSQPGTVSATSTGVGGNVNLYYWVTARYPIGVTMPKGPATAVRTAGVAGLGASPVVVSWQAVPGATGYDVIRGTTTTILSPANACVNCVVSSNQATTSFTDAGGGVVNWPTAGTVMATSKIITMAMNNRDESYPYLAINGEFHSLATRSTLDYAYLYNFEGNMTGGAAQKTYLLNLTATRPTTAAATGDSNDAVIKGVYNNYAKNDANFIERGINMVANNRSPGTLGMLDNLISVSSKSGSTSPIVNGLTVNAENFGTNANQHSGIDVSIKNEAAKATLEFGIRVRNLNNSLANASDAVLLVPADALANTGWLYGIDFNGAKIATDLRTHAGNQLLSGTGAPAGGLCTAPTLGSIYLNVSGGAGTSLYVCEVAGAWAAK